MSFEFIEGWEKTFRIYPSSSTVNASHKLLLARGNNSWYPDIRCTDFELGVTPWLLVWFLDVFLFREAVNSVMPLVCGSSRFACIECVFPEPLQGCYNVNAAVLFLDIYTKNSRWSWDAVDLIQSLLERRPKLKRCPLHEENCVTQLSFRYSFELINLSSRWNLQRGMVETYVWQLHVVNVFFSFCCRYGYMLSKLLWTDCKWYPTVWCDDIWSVIF